MHLLAVTALEAMKDLPLNTWLKIGAGVVVLILALIIIPKILKMNKLILGVIVFVGSTIVFFSWVSQRNEPKFLTPLMDSLTPFFSSKTLRVDNKNDPKPKPKPKS